MKSMIKRGAALGFTLLFSGLAFAAGQATGEKAKTAEPVKAVEAVDMGKATFEKACGSCHGLELSTELRHTKEEWQKLVQSMVDKGAEIKKEELPAVTDYLAANFGVKQLSEDACSGCHGFESVAEQRLSKDDWENMVQAMVDRGAYLSKEQIPLVIEYLAKTYPNN
jgi:mono/diheme cytochrome c family protein